MPVSSAKPMAAGCPGVGEGDHHVRVDRRLAGELAAHLPPRLVERAALHHRVRPGEVDELEGAHGTLRRLGRDPAAAHPGRIDGHDLAWVDLADEVGADDIQGAGLAGDDVAGAARRLGIAVAAEAEGPDAERVTGGHQRVAGEEKQAVGAVDPGQGAAEGGVEAAAGGAHQQATEHLGVAGGDELDALVRQLGADLPGVDEVAVVGEHDRADLAVLEAHRLSVGEPWAARRAVAGVTDGDVADQVAHDLVVEDLRDQAHLLVHQDVEPVAHRDPGRTPGRDAGARTARSR